MRILFIDIKKRVINLFKDGNFYQLKPSKFNSYNKDRTIVRIINFCFRWNYGNIYIISLFGLFSKSTSQLSKSKDPVGVNYNLIKLITL